MSLGQSKVDVLAPCIRCLIVALLGASWSLTTPRSAYAGPNEESIHGAVGTTREIVERALSRARQWGGSPFSRMDADRVDRLVETYLGPGEWWSIETVQASRKDRNDIAWPKRTTLLSGPCLIYARSSDGGSTDPAALAVPPGEGRMLLGAGFGRDETGRTDARTREWFIRPLGSVSLLGLPHSLAADLNEQEPSLFSLEVAAF